MNKKEEEIQRKLSELESTVLKEQTDLTTVSGSTTAGMSTTGGSSQTAAGAGEGPSTKSDGAYFGGIGLILLGLVLVFQHVRVGSSLFAMLGMGSGGFAILFLPLLIGLGMMFYDSKNKWGWIITSLSCLFLILAMMASLTITFPGVTLLTMIIMFVPFALGGALLVKGLGGAKGVEQSIKAQLSKKEG